MTHDSFVLLTVQLTKALPRMFFLFLTLLQFFVIFLLFRPRQALKPPKLALKWAPACSAPKLALQKDEKFQWGQKDYRHINCFGRNELRDYRYRLHGFRN